MIPSCSTRHSLYHTHLNLSGQHRLFPCPGLTGEIKKVHPLLSQCSVRLAGSLGQNDEQGQRWQYILDIPIMILGEKSAFYTSLRLYPELATPLPEETMRFSGGLHLDVDLPELSARLVEEDRCELRFSARVSMYLSV